MCIAAILPWIVGAASVASIVKAFQPPPAAPNIPDPPAPAAPPPTPAAPVLAPTPAAPTVVKPPTPPEPTAVNPQSVSVSAGSLAKDDRRRRAALESSWLTTKQTGASGLLGSAATKKLSLLGGISTPLGSGGV